MNFAKNDINLGAIEEEEQRDDIKKKDTSRQHTKLIFGFQHFQDLF